MLQKLKPSDKVKWLDFCSKILEQLAVNDTFLDKLVFSDEATFHLSGQDGFQPHDLNHLMVHYCLEKGDLIDSPTEMSRKTMVTFEIVQPLCNHMTKYQLELHKEVQAEPQETYTIKGKYPPQPSSHDLDLAGARSTISVFSVVVK
ncbi:hypothetical protein J437_LFUL001753 [Ladona fulva]|uniref:Uncharacterized protein n=1 Tax=Ladona fulva TaxID=123851 RepID=A0A8K0JWI2_LADFU|nr:hypothetical protein J437_LFUL001753 [Ladona fulva]